MPELRLSIDAGPVAGNDVRAAVRIAAALRCDGMVVGARSASADLTQLSGTGSREYLHVLSSLGQQLVGIGHDVGPAGLSPRADLGREVESLAAVLRSAGGLGRPAVLVDLGPLPPPPVAPVAPRPAISPEQAGLILIPEPAAAPPPTPAAPISPADAAFAASVEAALREVGAQADRHGVVVAFRASLAPLAALAHALREVDCPWFGVDLDPLAVLADEADRHAVFSLIGPLIRHVRARDGLRGAGNRVRPTVLGQGQVDWPAFAADVEAAGYAGFVTIDVRDVASPQSAAAAAAAVLRPRPDA